MSVRVIQKPLSATLRAGQKKTSEQMALGCLKAVHYYEGLRFASRHDGGSNFIYLGGKRRICDTMLPGIYAELQRYGSALKNIVREKPNFCMSLPATTYIYRNSRLKDHILRGDTILTAHSRMMQEFAKARRLMRRAQHAKGPQP